MNLFIRGGRLSGQVSRDSAADIGLGQVCQIGTSIRCLHMTQWWGAGKLIQGESWAAIIKWVSTNRGPEYYKLQLSKVPTHQK